MGKGTDTKLRKQQSEHMGQKNKSTEIYLPRHNEICGNGRYVRCQDVTLDRGEKNRTYVWIVCATDAFVQSTVSQSHIEERERKRTTLC